MAKKTLTQFLDEYEDLYNEAKKFRFDIDNEFSSYLSKKLNEQDKFRAKLVDECADENGILDLCDSRIFVERAFDESCKKSWERIKISEIVISVPVKTIPKNMFFALNVKKITFPETLKEIGESAFGYCENLRQIALPEGLKEIGKGAFARCTKLMILEIFSSTRVDPDFNLGWDAVAKVQRRMPIKIIYRDRISSTKSSIENDSFSSPSANFSKNISGDRQNNFDSNTNNSAENNSGCWVIIAVIIVIWWFFV